MVRPPEFEGDPVSHRSQALVAMEFLQRIAEPHVGELTDGSRRQPVAARLFTGKLLLFHREHRVASFREPVGRGGTCGTGTDNEDIDTAGRRCATGRSALRSLLRRGGPDPRSTWDDGHRVRPIRVCAHRA